MSIALHLLRDEATPHARRMAAALRRPEVRMVAARGVRNALQGHFQTKQETGRNKRGWKRQNFWSQVRRSVQAPTASGDVTLVEIDHVGIAQRFFGGVIRARNVTYLTIPAQEKAYGKRAREFNNLEFGMAPDPERGFVLRPALIESRATEVRRTKKGYRARSRIGGVMFWLARQVEQDPDPSALPKDEAVAMAAERPVNAFLDREEQK